METQRAPSASGIVYLFGDRFAKKARLGGEQLVHGGAKVSPEGLANQLLLFAFARFASDGYLQMEQLEQKRMKIFVDRDVRLTRTGEPSPPLYGLEVAIWENIRDDPDLDRVTNIIRRIIQTTSSRPWDVIVDKAKEGLLEQGYLATEKEVRRFRPDKVHWSAEEAQIAPHEGKVDEVKSMLDSFEARDPTLYKELVGAVKRGIRSMYESPDYDFDSD